MKFCRNYYFITFWPVGEILIWSFLLKTTNLTEINGNLPGPQVLSRIINEFVKPILKSFSLDNTLFRTFKNTAVEKAVKERIEYLQEFLQDNDVNIYNKDNYILEHNQETAIVEFLPKTINADNRTKLNRFTYNLKEYKTITHKIQKALTKDSVSEKTKSLIMNTLDGLVKKLIEGQCNWKRTRLEKTGGPYIIVNEWKAGWRQIKDTISKFLASDPRRNSNIPKYVDNLHKILKKVTRDADLISKKYKIQCNFVPKVYLSTTENTNNLRYNWDKTEMEADKCQNVVVCSNELSTFMLNFYKYLNDTTVSVLKNYAEMYDKEVHTGDAEENKYIVSLLTNISNDLQGYVSEVFIKETTKFKLDKGKNPDANIQFISDYIKNNIKNVKEKIRKILRTHLVNIKEKIVHGIRNDVMVNLNVELGNLEQEFLKQICTAFRLCSGNYAGRRQFLFSDSVNKNNLNLQVQLTFDDKLPGFRRQEFELPLDKTTKAIQYVSDFNVTRTTLIYNATLK